MRRSTLAFLFEGQFALLVIILIFSTTSIFTTLDMSQSDYPAFHADREWTATEGTSHFSLILRHIEFF